MSYKSCFPVRMTGDNRPNGSNRDITADNNPRRVSGLSFMTMKKLKAVELAFPF